MHPFTILYRGFEIDPVSDPNEDGSWEPCGLAVATHFLIFPPDPNLMCLDHKPTSLGEAKAVINSMLEAKAIVEAIQNVERN